MLKNFRVVANRKAVLMEFDPNNPAHQPHQPQRQPQHEPQQRRIDPQTGYIIPGDKYPPQYSGILGRYLTQQEIHDQMVQRHRRIKAEQDAKIAQVAAPVAEPIAPELPGVPGVPGMSSGSNGGMQKLQNHLEREADLLNPFKGENEKKAIRNLTDRQYKGFKKSQHHEDLQKATDSTRNDKGCTFVEVNTGGGTEVHKMMVDAMTGATNPTLVIDQTGQAAEFDGRYKGNAKGKQGLKNKLFEVEALSPQNAAQESMDRAFIRSKLAEWERQGEIAHRCGCEMLIMLPDADLVQFANQNLKLSPRIRIQEAKLGGTRSEVRANTVGGQFHHMPSAYAIDGFMGYGKGWGIWMRTKDHLDTKSHGSNGEEGEVYRSRQRMLIQSGKYRQVIEEDMKDAATIQNGLYDISIRQMLKTLKKRGVK
jgi:hypothetical protein